VYGTTPFIDGQKQTKQDAEHAENTLPQLCDKVFSLRFYSFYAECKRKQLPTYVSITPNQPVDAGTFMITTKQENVLWIFDLVCQCQTYCFQ